MNIYKKLLEFGGVFRTTIISTLVILSLGIYDFILPIFTDEQVANYAFVGLIVSLIYVASFLSEIPVGLAVDKYGRIKILLSALFCMATLGVIYYIFAENIIILAILSLIFGIISVAFWIPSAVLIRDFSPRKMLSQAEGIYMSITQIGWILGPAIGGFIAAALAAKFNFLIIALLLTLATIFSVFIFKGKKVEQFRKIEKGHKHTPKITLLATIFKEFVQLHKHSLPLYIMCFIAHMWIAIEWAFVALTVIDVWKVNEIFAGALLGAMMITEGVLYYSAGYVMDKIGKRYIITAGFLILFAATYFMFLSPSLYVFCITALFGAAAIAWILPGLEASLTEILPEDLYGEMSGVFDTSKDLGLAIGPLVGGVIISAFNAPLMVYLLVTLLSAFAALIGGYVFWPKRSKIKIK
ncbi:MAG: MFS transporter [Candidatus Nanoarchaeia archaeon]